MVIEGLDVLPGILEIVELAAGVSDPKHFFLNLKDRLNQFRQLYWGPAAFYPDFDQLRTQT